MLILPGAASPVRAGRCGLRGLSGGSLRGRLRPYRGFLAFLPAVGQRFPPGPRAARAAAVGHGHPAEGPGVRWVGKGPLSGWGWRSPGWEPRQRPVQGEANRTRLRGLSKSRAPSRTSSARPAPQATCGGPRSRSRAPGAAPLSQCPAALSRVKADGWPPGRHRLVSRQPGTPPPHSWPPGRVRWSALSGRPRGGSRASE